MHETRDSISHPAIWVAGVNARTGRGYVRLLELTKVERDGLFR